MLAYWLCLGVILVMGLFQRGYHAKNGKDSEGIVIGVCCFVMFLLSALRDSSVGADTAHYETLFTWVSRNELQYLINPQSGMSSVDHSDLWFRIFLKGLSFFSTNPRAVTVALSGILYLELAHIVRHQTSDPWLALLLFFTLGFFQLAMNLTPSIVATLIAMRGFGEIERRRPLRYLCYVAAAAVFHPGAVILAVAYPLSFLRLSNRSFVLILVIGTSLSFLLWPQIITLIERSFLHSYLRYFTRARLSFDKILVWFVHLLLFSICWLGQKERGKTIELHPFESAMFLVESIVYLLTIQSDGLHRGAFLFSLYVIVLIPNMLTTARCRKQLRVFESEPSPVHSNPYKTAIILLTILQYVMRVQINNIGWTIPYTSIL